MQRVPGDLITPVFIKFDDKDEDWPNERVFYLLTRDGLFLCRNHEFFRSCVAAPRWPSELASHEPFLKLDYPKIPQEILETAVGFFDWAWQTHGGESGMLLAWDRQEEKIVPIVPRQIATVSRNGWGDVFPIGLHYEAPADLPPHVAVFCDIHSHCDMAAYASGTDTNDETYLTGLHLVVGKLHNETPQFHVEAVADGVRFKVNKELIVGEFQQRRTDFPEEWKERIKAFSYGYGRGRYDPTLSFEENFNQQPAPPAGPSFTTPSAMKKTYGNGNSSGYGFGKTNQYGSQYTSNKWSQPEEE